MKIKVAVLHNIITPYRIPLFNEISKLPGIDLTVLFLSKTASNRKWDISKYATQMKFKYKILPSFSIPLPIKDEAVYIVNPTIFSELQKGYDVVISAGWLDFSCQVAALTKLIFKHKYVIWSESTAAEASWQRELTKRPVSLLIRTADGSIAIGTRSAQYLASMGARLNRMVTAYSTVDVDFFRKRSIQLGSNISFLKKKYGIPIDNQVVLYVGQFIPRKNISTLLAAVARLQRNDITLVLVGYGPLIDEYMQQAAELNISSIVFLSHLEVKEMVGVYTLADVFVLPSKEETWGLVVNEAMACGLPVIVSTAVGCSTDLVYNGKNGFIFNPDNVFELYKSLSTVLGSSRLKSIMKAASLAIITEKTPKHAAAAFGKIVNKILS